MKTFEAVSNRMVLTMTGIRLPVESHWNLDEGGGLRRTIEAQHEIERIAARAQLEVALGRPVAGRIEELFRARRAAQALANRVDIRRLARETARDQIGARIVFPTV